MSLDSTFKYQIKLAIDQQKKNNFQDFIDKLLLHKYDTKYLPTRQYRDKGCDGIIDGKEVIAVYAPESIELEQFKKKLTADYQLYVTNWKSTYPMFKFIVNAELTAEMIIHCDETDNAIGRLGIDQLVHILEGLQWTKIRDIAFYLNIDEQYFIHDILKCVVDDLLNEDSQQNILNLTTPPNIVEKIKANYDPNDVQSAIDQYENILPTMGALKVILSSYADSEISALKDKILTLYNKLSGDFKSRLESMVELLGTKSPQDELYLYFIKVVLIYFFEICLIGKKV